MKKHLLIFLLLFAIPLLTIASDKPFSRGRLNASYFGELLLHPGGTIGADCYLADLGRHELHLGAEIGGYHHKWYQNAFMFNYYLGIRLKSKNRFYFDPQLTFAFFFTQPDGDIYTTAYSDEYPLYPVEPNLRFGTTLLFGWDFKDNPWEVFLGPDIYLESKVNYQTLPHLAFRFGLAYELGGE